MEKSEGKRKDQESWRRTREARLDSNKSEEGGELVPPQREFSRAEPTPEDEYFFRQERQRLAGKERLPRGRNGAVRRLGEPAARKLTVKERIKRALGLKDLKPGMF